MLGWHSNLSESSSKIPTALSGSKDFLFHVCIVIQLFLCADTWVDQFSSAFKLGFAMIPARSAPYPAFQLQRVVVLSGTIYIPGDRVHSGR